MIRDVFPSVRDGGFDDGKGGGESTGNVSTWVTEDCRDPIIGNVWEKSILFLINHF